MCNMHNGDDMVPAAWVRGMRILLIYSAYLRIN